MDLPSHDQARHLEHSDASLSKLVLSCERCRRAHRPSGLRLLASFGTVALLVLASALSPPPLSPLLVLAALVLLVVPIRPLDRWVRTGAWRDRPPTTL